MRLAVAVLLCAGLAAGCNRPDPDEKMWFCNVGDNSISFERAESYGSSVDYLIMCHHEGSLPCDLVPEEMVSPPPEDITITLSRCEVDLPCLLRALNVTGDSFKSFSIVADIPPPVDVLAGLGHIESLTLDGYREITMKKTVPVSTVYSLQKVTSFSMRKAQLSLPAEGFAQPSPLTELTLSYGGLTHLSPGVFRGLQKLKKLDLSGNKFWNLTEEALEGLSSLEHFIVSKSGLQMLGDLTRVTPQLKTLMAYDNKLQAAPAVAGLQHLERIALGRNQITSLAPNAFADLPALKDLKLESNQISALPATVFRNSNNIQTLYLQMNQIEELPADVFKGLSSLESLQLNKNRLRTLPPGVFQECSSLEDIYLTHNQLAQLSPEVFQPLTALRQLYLGDNSLEELPDNLFQSQSKLTVVELSHNSLRHVAPRALDGARYLEVLNLSYNKLTTVYNSNTAGQGQSTPFHGLNSLRRLELSHNQIRDTFPQGTRLARVANLSHND